MTAVWPQETPLTNAELGELVYGAIDDAGFADTMRARVREAVEGAMVTGAADADVRASRAAGERLGDTLTAHDWDVVRSRRAHRARAAAQRTTSVENSEQRATAFRIMAGVRV